MLDPLQNLVSTRVIECFTECLPGSVLQTYAYIRTGHSKAALTSIFLSAMTTAYVTATISYDLDTDPKKRENNPRFYGYIPNSPWNRGVSFILLLASNFFYALSRTISVALIFLVDVNLFLYYTACDMALFLLYKIMTCDLAYNVPIKYYSTLMVISGLYRIVCKFVNDFTGCQHMRSPSELGGLYWTLSSVFGVSLTFVALDFYIEKEDALLATEPPKVKVRVNRELVEFLVYMWYISFFAMLVLIYFNDKRFLGSFWSVETAKESACNEWRLGHNDELKMKIFRKPKMYRAAIEDDVIIWVQENFGRWCEEYFMTEKLLKTIPKYMLPEDSSEIFKNARKSNSLFLIKKKSLTLRKISLAEQEDMEEERMIGLLSKKSRSSSVVAPA